MKSKILAVILAILIVINLSAFATLTYNRYCKNSDNCPKKQTYKKGEMLCQELSLSPDQMQEIKTLSHSFHVQSDSISQLLTNQRTKLVKLLSNEQPDNQKLDQILEDINQLQADLQKNVINYLIKEKETLTPEQQVKFFNIIQDRLTKEALCRKNGGLDFIENSCPENCENKNNCTHNSN